MMRSRTHVWASVCPGFVGDRAGRLRRTHAGRRRLWASECVICRGGVDEMLMPNDEISPWVGYVATILIMVAAAEAGRFLGLRWARQRPDALAPDVTTLESAGLGLRALRIGFTFPMALTRFDARLR